MEGQHEIVILGAHHAGITIAHYLLRHVAPQLAVSTSIDFHVTIVAPNTEFYHNVSGINFLCPGTGSDINEWPRVFLGYSEPN